VIDPAAGLDKLPDPLPVTPLANRLDAAITPPGSKSITCRAYVCAALAEGESRIRRPLAADDTDRLLAALAALGAGSRREEDDVVIEGVGGRFPRGGEVDLGDGGAPARFMIAAACLAAEPVIVDGSQRLRERPMAELVDLLRALGGEVEYLQAEGRLPVRVRPSGSVGGSVDCPTTRSSQFVSALLLVAPHMAEDLHLRLHGPRTSASYVDLTVAVLRAWGVAVETASDAIAVSAGRPSGRECDIPPDASSAVPWWTAAALGEGWSICIPGLTGEPFQPDEAYPDCLCRMGAEILGDHGGVRGGASLHPPETPIDMSLLPDAAMSLAALAARARGPTTLTGLETLRVKETDRIAALAAELERIGCAVRATDEALTIDPAGCHERPVVIETYRDHRMAMAFAVLGLARGGISIRDPACVAKSYPGFWRDLGSLYER
jgi:3-phosphoshikimate 1-carboxyvinyltransferase